MLSKDRPINTDDEKIRIRIMPDSPLEFGIMYCIVYSLCVNIEIW